MSSTSWLILGAVSGVGYLFARWLYANREVAVAGSMFLAVLRALILALVALLLLNPSVPWNAAGVARGTWVLLDGSLSMQAEPLRGVPSWDEAVDRAERLLPADGELVLFGEGARRIELRELGELAPSGRVTRLTRAVELVAEAGATSAVVVSDLRIRDLESALARAEALGVSLGFEDVGGDVRNVGILGADFPTRVEPSDTFSAEVTLFGSQADRDSVRVEVRREGRLVGSQAARVPAEGGVGRVRLQLPAPGEEPESSSGIRYTAKAVLDGDGFQGDDERVGYVRTGEEVGGLVLASLRPDWEPRFLLPVLAQVSGLETVAYLRVGPGMWLQAGGRLDEPTRRVTEELVGRRALAAELVVLHGLEAGAPEWASQAVERGQRVLLLPSDVTAAASAGLNVRNPAAGEWYAVTPPPPSPIAGGLADADFSDLPPLSSVMASIGDPTGRPVLTARLGAAGATHPALVVRESGRRRLAIATGSGFWRWALQGGSASEAYRRLWSALVGWMMESERVASPGGVRPSETVLGVGQPIDWAAPGHGGDSISVTLEAEGSEPKDTTVAVLPTERFRTSTPGPGTYRFSARQTDGTVVGAGRLEIEAWTDELLTRAGAPDTVSGGASTEQRLTSGLQVRTHPVPYLMLIGLLALEWIGRRRRGLR